MSDPQAKPKSNDSVLTIAADFARVIWSPTAVFRRRLATRTWRVLFVLWVITSVLTISLLLGIAVSDPEVLMASADADRIAERDLSILQIVAVLVVATPFLGIVVVLLEAAIWGGGVWLGAKALGLQLPMNRAVVIAALSSVVTVPLFIPAVVGVFLTGWPAIESTSETPGWMQVLELSLGPLAPESRPILRVLLSAFGIPAFWLAALHAIGARQMTGFVRPLKFTLPVFWAAAVAVSLAVATAYVPMERGLEAAARAAEKAAEAERAARTEPVPTRAPARAP